MAVVWNPVLGWAHCRIYGTVGVLRACFENYEVWETICNCGFCKHLPLGSPDIGLVFGKNSPQTGSQEGWKSQGWFSIGSPSLWHHLYRGSMKSSSVFEGWATTKCSLSRIVTPLQSLCPGNNMNLRPFL